jgi:hypothetical protein
MVVMPDLRLVSHARSLEKALFGVNLSNPPCRKGYPLPPPALLWKSLGYPGGLTSAMIVGWTVGSESGAPGSIT